VSLLAQDRALLDRFRVGDRRVMEQVYRHYAPQVSALVYGGLPTQSARVRARSPYDVGSIVQEVFTRAFTEKARHSYDGVSPYLQYLIAIARNFMLNELRMREDVAEPATIESALSASRAPAAVAASPASPDELAEQNELDGLVSRFLLGRNERERRIFHARFEQLLTQEETASALGLTRIQVRRSEAHLRRDLFAVLRASGYLDQARLTQSSLLPAAPEAPQVEP
jgi:RNA polymerase sigma-70 factor, ECF subfamily